VRSAGVDIDLAALQHNLGACRQLVGQSTIFGVVKADAYGHGLVNTARVLRRAPAAVEGLAVASVAEAVLLRESGDEGLLLLLDGVQSGEELLLAQRHRLALVLHTTYQLELLSRHQALAPFQVWIKADTGMHRLGFDPAEISAVLARLKAEKLVSRPPGLMTHLASADELESGDTAAQLACFETISDRGISARSAANSAAILAWPGSHYQWVRPGIMLYGASPFAGETGVARGLKPVMQFSAPVISIRQLQQGDRIGYGGAGLCSQQTRLAVVAVGYGDGYPRHARQGAPVLLGGVRCPLLGRVSMDLLTIDVTAAESVVVGDEAILWGHGLPVEEVAEAAGTISYELLTRVTSRPRRLYRGA